MFFREWRIKDETTKKTRRIFFFAMLGEPDMEDISNIVTVEKPKRRILYSAFDVTEEGKIDKKAFEEGARQYLEGVLKDDGLIPQPDTLDSQASKFRDGIMKAYQINLLKKHLAIDALEKLEDKGALDIEDMIKQKEKFDELRHIVKK